jgi:hypothetical protein
MPPPIVPEPITAALRIENVIFAPLKIAYRLKIIWNRQVAKDAKN